MLIRFNVHEVVARKLKIVALQEYSRETTGISHSNEISERIIVANNNEFPLNT